MNSYSRESTFLAIATLSLIPNPRCIEWPSLPSVGKSYVFSIQRYRSHLSFFQYLWHHPKWTPLRSMSRVHNGLYYKKYLLLSQENYQLKMAHRFLYDLTHSLVYQTHLSQSQLYSTPRYCCHSPSFVDRQRTQTRLLVLHCRKQRMSS